MCSLTYAAINSPSCVSYCRIVDMTPLKEFIERICDREMPSRKNKKLVVANEVREEEERGSSPVSSPEVLPADAPAPEVIAAAEESVETDELHAPQLLATEGNSAVDTSAPAQAESNGDGENEASPPRPPAEALEGEQHDAAVSDQASPMYPVIAEGDDGGDTREGSAGNPNFSNADTDTLPVADADALAILSHSGNEVLGAADQDDAPTSGLVLEEQPVTLRDDADDASPILHANSTRYLTEPPYELTEDLAVAADAVPPIHCGAKEFVEPAGDSPDRTLNEGAYVVDANVAVEAATRGEAATPQVSIDAIVAERITAAEELVENVKESVVSLTHYVDTRLDRCHVSILNVEEQLGTLSTDILPNAIDRSAQYLRKMVGDSAEELRAALQSKSHELSSSAEQAVAEAYDSLAGAVRDATTRVEDGYQLAVARMESQHKFLIDQLSQRVSDLDDRATTTATQLSDGIVDLKFAIEQVDQRLRHAMRMEILPPADPLPTEGIKMRLVITVDCPGSSSQSKTVLVPVTDVATVGMLKREVLRRAVQQSIVPQHMQTLFVFSKTVVILDGITLFEEDTLADVGIAANDKLVIQSSDPALLLPTPQSQLPLVDALAGITQPPSMPGLSVPANFDATTVSALTATGGAELLSPLQSPLHDVAPPAKQVGENIVVFLDADVYSKLAEQESLERRLNTELARMEMEPLKREEESKRITVLKAIADKVRITLLDRATYSHVDYERRAARGALEKINEAIGTGATSAGIIAATQSAKTVLISLSTNLGEDDRVSAMEAAAKTERNRKERILEDLKDLIFTVRHRMRIPPELYGAAETLLFAADRAILLAPSSTVKDVDDVHKEFSEFVDKIRSTQQK